MSDAMTASGASLGGLWPPGGGGGLFLRLPPGGGYGAAGAQRLRQEHAAAGPGRSAAGPERPGVPGRPGHGRVPARPPGAAAGHPAPGPGRAGHHRPAAGAPRTLPLPGLSPALRPGGAGPGGGGPGPGGHPGAGGPAPEAALRRPAAKGLPGHAPVPGQPRDAPGRAHHLPGHRLPAGNLAAAAGIWRPRAARWWRCPTTLARACAMAIGCCWWSRDVCAWTQGRRRPRRPANWSGYSACASGPWTRIISSLPHK